jgi:hypothetical protein
VGGIVGIRRKAIIIWLAVLLFFDLFLILSAELILVPRYEKLEAEINRQGAVRVYDLIDSQIDAQASIARDLAVWEETCEFLTGDNLQYVQRNYPFDTFVDTDFDAIAIFDLDGTSLLQMAYDVGRKELTQSPEAFSVFNASMLNHRDRNDLAGRGILREKDGRLLMYGAHVVRGPRADSAEFGYLMVGKYFDAEEKATLRKLASQWLIFPEGQDLVQLEEAGLYQGSERRPLLSQVGSGGLNTSGFVRDYQGQPLLTFSLVRPRDITSQGQKAVIFFLIYVNIVGIVLGVIGLRLLDKAILRRIQRMTKAVSQVGEGGAIHLPAESGQDEIASLNDSIGTMLSSIQEKTHKLELARNDLNTAKDKAEAASQAKGKFLAQLTHEIRTPLHGIIGLTQVIRQAGLTGQQDYYTVLLDHAARGMLELLNNVLDLERLDANQMGLGRQSFDPRALLKEIYGLYASRGQAKGLACQLHFGPGVPGALFGDALRLRQVVLNLVDNAIKFTSTGYVRMDVDWDATQMVLIVAVKDSGPGIAPQLLNTLFDEYSQGQEDTGQEPLGSGLGLYISCRLVRAMGGTMEVAPGADEGTVFTVALPMDKDESLLCLPSYAPEDPAPERVGIVHILVADDGLVNREIVAAMLPDEYFAVTMASDGARAVQIVAAGGVDLVLMDLAMPVLDGLEALKQIRQLKPIRLARVPIICFSAHAADLMEEQCLQAGADAFLGKPFDLKDLTDKIFALLPPDIRPWQPERLPVEGVTLASGSGNPLLLARGHLLQMLGSEEAANNLLQKYFNNWETVKINLLSACLAGDQASLRQLLHLMKGQAGNLGLTGMAGAADQILHCPMDDDVAIAKRLIEIIFIGDECARQMD